MAKTQGNRRSGRIRKAVSTYAEEQAEQAEQTAPPAKRKKPAAADEETPRKVTKKAKSQSNDEVAEDPPAVTEPSQDDQDFKPKTKKSRKKRAVPAIGKLDSEGVMRLDVTEPRPPGEKRPPKVYPIPPRSNAKGKSSVNLSAILAESFEDRWERKVSKIPRLAPGQPEVRLKK
jgi:hypothetical protein